MTEPCTKEREIEAIGKQVNEIHTIIVGNGTTPGIAEILRVTSTRSTMNQGRISELEKTMRGNGDVGLIRRVQGVEDFQTNSNRFRRKEIKLLLIIVGLLVFTVLGVTPSSVEKVLGQLLAFVK